MVRARRTAMHPGRFARALILAPLLALAFASAAHAEPPRPPATPHPTAPAHPTAVAPAHTQATTARATSAPPRVATPSLDVSIPVRAARSQLLAVREEVAHRAQAGEKPVVVFDIDDTLLTWPRSDLPNRQVVPGALEYLTSLKAAGAKIVYITGRHEPDRAETVKQLEQFGFPIGKEEHLVLNDTKLETVEYKAVATRTVVKTLGKPIAVFENEKENARMFRRELPDASTNVFRLRTTTMHPDSGGDGPITVIDDFTAAAPKEIRLSKQASPPAS